MCHESQLPQSGSLLHELHRRRPGDRGARPHRRDQRAARIRVRIAATRCAAPSRAARTASCARITAGTTTSTAGWSRYRARKRSIATTSTRAKWGLGKAAQVASYRGFVFATLDPTAPPLEDYLGWVGRLGIDMLASNGDLEVRRRHPEESSEVQLEARGRQPVRLVSREDLARLGVAHRLRAGRSDGADEPDGDPRRIRPRHRRAGRHASGARRIRRAHEVAAAASRKWYDMMAGRRLDPRVQQMLGPVGTRSFGHPNIFPNLWITQFNQVCLRIPRGPYETELWWFTLMPKDLPEDQRRFAHLHGEPHVRPGRPARAGRRRELEPLDARCKRRVDAHAAAQLRDGPRPRSRRRPTRRGRAASKRW